MRKLRWMWVAVLAAGLLAAIRVERLALADAAPPPPPSALDSNYVLRASIIATYRAYPTYAGPTQPTATPLMSLTPTPPQPSALSPTSKDDISLPVLIVFGALLVGGLWYKQVYDRRRQA